MMPRCFKYLLTVIFIIFCSSIALANDTAAHVVNAGSTTPTHPTEKEFDVTKTILEHI